jgi:hypothetical protein
LPGGYHPLQRRKPRQNVPEHPRPHPQPQPRSHDDHPRSHAPGKSRAHPRPHPPGKPRKDQRPR